ncbi:MAG: hypothetical protein WHT46_10420 [Candidatus Geothermincolales bacterium]
MHVGSGMRRHKAKYAAVLMTVLLLVLAVSSVSCRGKGKETTPPVSTGQERSEESVEQQVDEIIEEIDSLLEGLDPGAFDEESLGERELGL